MLASPTARKKVMHTAAAEQSRAECSRADARAGGGAILSLSTPLSLSSGYSRRPRPRLRRRARASTRAAAASAAAAPPSTPSLLPAYIAIHRAACEKSARRTRGREREERSNRIRPPPLACRDCKYTYGYVCAKILSLSLSRLSLVLCTGIGRER